MKSSVKIAILLFMLVLAALSAWPQIDLAVSGWFYTESEKFYLASSPCFTGLQWIAYYGARALGMALILMALAVVVRRKPIWGIDEKGWIFLFVALLVAPGLVGNVLLKDHWGRARPREILSFGGSKEFSPPLEPQPVAHKNCSFISGDASFGFYLTSFAYVVPLRDRRRRWSRRFFWAGMGAGGLFSIARLAMGAHFLSDVLFACFFMLATIAGLHALIYGRRETVSYWRAWFPARQKMPPSGS